MLGKLEENILGVSVGSILGLEDKNEDGEDESIGTELVTLGKLEGIVLGASVGTILEFEDVNEVGEHVGDSVSNTIGLKLGSSDGLLIFHVLQLWYGIQVGEKLGLKLDSNMQLGFSESKFSEYRLLQYFSTEL